MGIVAQFLVQISNYAAPFNISIVFFTLMIIFTLKFWPENYGNKQAKPSTSFISAIDILRADPRIVILGMCTALFEASLHIFVTEWTPTLQQAVSPTGSNKLPLGFIFAIFMFFDMIGSLLFYPLAKRIQIQSYMILIYLLSAIILLIPVLFPQSFITIWISFFAYEVCVGIGRPSLSMLRNSYIPNEARVTIMSFIRIPQIIMVSIVLLGHFSISVVFILCLVLNILAMFGMIILRNLRIPDISPHADETQILLEDPSSPLFQMKRPQIRVPSSASLIPQNPSKFDDEDPSTSTINHERIHSLSNNHP
ncbi:hypothetical protein I4U23_020238 [Adineta vaga]|nr:hypothetical protein I4U23_020238 [Adineta vaga]